MGFRHGRGAGPYAALVLILSTSALDARAQDDADPGLGDFLRVYQADRSYVRRFHDLPWCEERAERMARLNREYQARLDALNFESLGVAGRIDWLLFRAHLTLQRSRLELESRRLSEMDALLPARRTLLELELARRQVAPLDLPEAAARLNALPDQIKALRERIEKGRAAPPAPAQSAPSASTPQSAPANPTDLPAVSPVVALRAAAAVSDLLRVLNSWAEAYQSHEPEFAWWMRQPRESAGKALDEYARYLRETVAGVRGAADDPLIGDPIGEAALLGDMSAEMLAYAPAELIAIAEREFAWCEAEMRKAALELGCGEDWKSALAAVKQQHVAPGAQDELVAEEARSAMRFLKERDLITIPPEVEEMWRVDMLTPAQQRLWPFQVYLGQAVGVSYPTDAMSHDDKLMSMRGNNRHFTHIVVQHELVPGHHLQGYMADRHRAYREIFATPFFGEGWAVYWELRMWELGFARGPHDRVGMLFWRMHRCARIIVSLKYHLGQMSATEMIDYLIERVGHERAGATSEVRRYVGPDYSPLYQCGYMIGALQLRALQRELVGGGTLTDKQFHDALLTYGAIPNELIRAGLRGEKLPREWTPKWRFAD